MPIATPKPALCSLVAFLAIQALLSAQSLNTSTEERCATTAVQERLLAADPQLAAVWAAIENHTAQAAALGTRSAVNTITIPVVVHVVWNQATENLSDSRIQSQIAVLNEDFRRLNADAVNTLAAFAGVAADFEIEFCLATRDPQGNATTGITRTQTSNTSFSSSSDNVKFTSTGGKDAWPRASYLNIWVCDISSGVLGYAQFPGGPAATDGVVCDYLYFGRQQGAVAPFDLGRTATHEVGHWLNLRHIWGDGGCGVDDLVADTPASDAPHYGCPLSDTSCGTLDMVQNYMDYSDDACMNIFTAGQKVRSRALFAPGGSRESILSSLGCTPPTPPTPQYQLNQPLASLNFDGVQGTSQNPATSFKCVGDPGTFSILSAVPSGLFQVGFAVTALVPASSPAAGSTPGGQIINLELGHPTVSYWGGGAPVLSPYPGNLTVPYVAPAAGTYSSQMLKIDGANIDGFVLSQGAQVIVSTAGGSPVAHTLGDDNSVLITLGPGGTHPTATPVTFFGTSQTSLYINANGSLSSSAGSGDFTPTATEFRNGVPRIAGFWSDLQPNMGTGNISSSYACGVLTVSFVNIPEWGSATNTVSFDMGVDLNTLFIDGVSVSGAWGTTSLVGFSPGGGVAGTSVTLSSLVGGTQNVGGNAVYQTASGSAVLGFTGATLQGGILSVY